MTNEYREWYKKHHICENCGKEKAWKNTTMCPECLEKNKIRSEKTRSEESKEQRRKYVKKKDKKKDEHIRMGFDFGQSRKTDTNVFVKILNK